MAIETGHLNVFPPQLISNGDLMNSSNHGNNAFAVNPQRGSTGFGFRQALPGNLVPIYDSQAKTSLIPDSSIRKRARDSMDRFYEVSNSSPATQKFNTISQFPSFAGEGVLHQMQQHHLEIDNIISRHTKKIGVELEVKQKQHTRAVLATIGETVTKKLKEKDEQIQKLAKLNLVLQERVKSLYVENHLWRDMAQTNEATAMSLRTNLEQVLAHVSEEHHSGGGVGGGPPEVVEEDAESCCGSSDYGRDIQIVNEDANCRKNRLLSDRTCKRCGERESTVLLMPCRHLCLCYICGSGCHGLKACPVCNCTVNGTLHVNTSS
ncbi:BOI-related E3 ubiquitin- ligase 1-like [Olea europaea subsp. europaea]|uniref:BOI-related E3 ubiquitin- ligase 1-like n=2 Tax=Olea europaea subsp. europaea TaxID=158383 RepID=A0A8S0V0E7_OLEEU|nr:BOI-related E3 ubiquitin- ligase 1-like [Olea europaea subsp. europaea]